MAWRVVASDMDGTLLAPNHRISALTRAVVEQLKTRGIPLILATGRPYPDVHVVMQNMGLSGYSITSNGSRVHSPDGQLIISKDIDTAAVTSILAHTTKTYPHVSTNIYRNDEWLTSVEVAAMSEAYKESGFRSQYVADLASVNPSGVHSIFFVGIHSDLEVVEKDILTKWADSVEVTFSHTHILDCVPKGTNKGSTVSEVVSQLGYKMEECIAFGDAMNDEHMLAMAGKGLIMQNGQERLKKALPHLEVIGSNAEDSVARYLLTAFGIPVSALDIQPPSASPEQQPQ